MILYCIQIFTENQRITKLVCHVILLGEAGEEALNNLLSCHTSPPMTSTAPPISKKLHPNNKRKTPEQNTPPLMTPTTDPKLFYEYVCVELYLNQNLSFHLWNQQNHYRIFKNFMWHKQQNLKKNINFKKAEKCINLLIKSNIKLV